MNLRAIKKVWREPQAALAAGLAILTLALISGLAARVWRLHDRYFSGSARRELTAALAALRDDTGWGLSNFEIEGLDCGPAICSLDLRFRYHAPPDIRPPDAEAHLTWQRGAPNEYVRR